MPTLPVPPAPPLQSARWSQPEFRPAGAPPLDPASALAPPSPAGPPSPELLAPLYTVGWRGLPPATRDRILACGQDLVPLLLAVMEDTADPGPKVTDEERRWARVYAAELLGHLRAPSALLPLLRQLGQSDLLIVYDAILFRSLRPYGAAVVEPALALYHEVDDDHKGLLVEVLATSKVRDERIYQLLVRGLEHEPLLAAEYLGRYGDPRGVELLRAFLSKVNFSDVAEAHGRGDRLVLDLVWLATESLRQLGAELTEHEQVLRARAMSPEERSQIDRETLVPDWERSLIAAMVQDRQREPPRAASQAARKRRRRPME